MIRYGCNILRAAHSMFICTTNVTLDAFLFQEKGWNLAHDSLIRLRISHHSLPFSNSWSFATSWAIRVCLGGVISAWISPILRKRSYSSVKPFHKLRSRWTGSQMKSVIFLFLFTSPILTLSINPFRKYPPNGPYASLIVWFDESLYLEWNVHPPKRRNE